MKLSLARLARGSLVALGVVSAGCSAYGDDEGSEDAEPVASAEQELRSLPESVRLVAVSTQNAAHAAVSAKRTSGNLPYETAEAAIALDMGAWKRGQSRFVFEKGTLQGQTGNGFEVSSIFFTATGAATPPSVESLPAARKLIRWSLGSPTCVASGHGEYACTFAKAPTTFFGTLTFEESIKLANLHPETISDEDAVARENDHYLRFETDLGRYLRTMQLARPGLGRLARYHVFRSGVLAVSSLTGATTQYDVFTNRGTAFTWQRSMYRLANGDFGSVDLSWSCARSGGRNQLWTCDREPTNNARVKCVNVPGVGTVPLRQSCLERSCIAKPTGIDDVCG